MLIGRFDFAKKIFQKVLGSMSTAMNDIQSELLLAGQAKARSLEPSGGLQVPLVVVFLSQLMAMLRCQRIHVDLPSGAKAGVPSP